MNRGGVSSPRMSPCQTASMDAVVITGVGAVTPLGHDFSTIAEALLAGTSGVRQVDGGPYCREQRQFAAAIDAIPVPPGIDPATIPHLDRLGSMCLTPLAAALADAGIDASAAAAAGKRIGLVLGLGAEHLKGWEADFLSGGQRVFSPQQAPSLVHILAGILGINGPAVTAAAACASSGYALALGRRWVRAGLVDVCLAGGCDILSPTGFAAFYNLRALSRRGDAPAQASRPFDRDRDGFVIGEGGAFLVLERYSDALARGVQPRGELAGVGMSGDASHMVIPSPDPTQAARAIALALGDAGEAPEEVDYINAHAAGTPVGDVAEAAAIRLAFGTAAERVPVSSTKSMSGHLLSGAAAFEAIACLAAIDRQCLPPTINLDSPDDRCPLDHIPHIARKRSVRVTASNSFGFGGANLCLVIRRVA
ncbi:MAG: beta-ketoacyl-[acyl-carrier-protein] synthase family protein [Planctomycetota bacterium]|nr:MAG: beta-ketoacyl-[acyl-carrier-protein] synthase family protein [Planctomycetota bacterium]